MNADSKTTAQAYPLQWPTGWPRTEKFARDKWPNPREVSTAMRQLNQAYTEAMQVAGRPAA